MINSLSINSGSRTILTLEAITAALSPIKKLYSYIGIIMLRFVVSFLFSIVIARWGYSEIKLSFPELVPLIDYSLEQVQIPTHDRWSAAKFGAHLERVGRYLRTQEAHAHEDVELDYEDAFSTSTLWNLDKSVEKVANARKNE